MTSRAVNPGMETATLYSPFNGRAAIVAEPAGPVTPWRMAPVEALVTVTVAPGTRAPDGSVTTTVMAELLGACAAAGAAARMPRRNAAAAAPARRRSIESG